MTTPAVAAPAANPAEIAVNAAAAANPQPAPTTPAPAEPAAPAAQPTGDTGEPAPAVQPVIELEVPAPAATPAADPATASAEPEADPKANEVVPVTYDPTGDAGLDVALGFVGKLGIGIDDPAMQATSKGDFSLIKAKLATMGAEAQGWEQMVALAEQAYTRSEADAKAVADKVSAAVVSVAGSAEQWNEIQAWASANATAEEKAELNAMFKAGPLQARAAAKLIVEQFKAAPGNTVEPASPTKATPSAQPAVSNTSLSARDYALEVKALAKKIGSGNLETSQEYAQLNARRAAHRN